MIQRVKNFSLLLIILSFFAETALNQEINNKFPIPKIEFNPRSYICYKTTEPLVIDGILDEKSWQQAEWTQNFIDIEGIVEPLYQTRAKLLWDDQYLYIAAELMEPHINGQLQQRDTVIFYDNDFEVFIDPDGDTHKYFEFEMNALNTVWDLLLVKPYRDGGPAVNTWNIAGLKSAVKIYGTLNDPSDVDEKWTVELAFPLQILKEGGAGIPKNKDVWRIGFSRVEWQYEIVDGKYKKKIDPQTGKPFPEYNWVWSPQGLINMHYPEMWGFLQFSDLKPSEGKVQFTLSEDEKMKWELRKIYYFQKNYHARFKKYTSKLTELELIGLKINKLNYSFNLKATKSLFTAEIKSNKVIWTINNEGRTQNISN